MLTIVGVRLPTGTRIVNRTRAVIDPTPVAEMLPPGSTVSDVIDLREMYPEVAKEILDGSHDLILHWTYKMKTRSGDESAELSGSLVIQAGK